MVSGPVGEVYPSLAVDAEDAFGRSFQNKPPMFVGHPDTVQGLLRLLGVRHGFQNPCR